MEICKENGWNKKQKLEWSAIFQIAIQVVESKAISDYHTWRDTPERSRFQVLCDSCQQYLSPGLNKHYIQDRIEAWNAK